MGTISKYDSNYSAMSLDEAFLDITDHLETRPFLDESQRTFPKHFVSINLNSVHFIQLN